MSLNWYDISDNQGDINNGEVLGDAIGIKATEGIGYTDPDCDANYQQAKAAGKLLSVYHFARPDGNPNGADEADWFVSQIQGYIGEAVLILDMENAPVNGDWVGWAKAFLDRVYEKTSVRPWIYMSQSKVNEHDWSSVWPNYALWVADYGMNMPINGYAIPSVEPEVNWNGVVAAWQYTSQGRLPGWGSFLDLDVFYGDADAWRKYAAKEVAPPPVEPPVAPPVVEPPVIVPPVVPPVETPPVEKPPVVIPPVVDPPVAPIQSPLKKSMLELLRMAIFSIPSLIIWVITNNPSLALGFGGPILLAAKTVDEYIHKNPNTDSNGLLPF